MDGINPLLGLIMTLVFVIIAIDSTQVIIITNLAITISFPYSKFLNIK